MTRLAAYLSKRSPFIETTTLFSIVSGVTADDSVNVDNAEEVG